MSPNHLSNLTIVIVEDHNDARAYLGLFLERLSAWAKILMDLKQKPRLLAVAKQIGIEAHIFVITARGSKAGPANPKRQFSTPLTRNAERRTEAGDL